MCLNNTPDLSRVNAEVIMCHYVSKTLDLRPWNFRVTFFVNVVNFCNHFADNNELHHCGIKAQLIMIKIIIVTEFFTIAFNFIYSIQNCQKGGAWIRHRWHLSG